MITKRQGEHEYKKDKDGEISHSEEFRKIISSLYMMNMFGTRWIKMEGRVARTKELMTLLLLCHNYLKRRDYLAEVGVT